MAELQIIQSTGKRKTAIAQVRMRPGTGVITVNGKPMDEYFTARIAVQMLIKEALRNRQHAGALRRHGAHCTGGGSSGQAGALRHGIARALEKVDSELRGQLKKKGSSHARRAQEGAQEVRAEGRPCALPVLEALGSGPIRASSFLEGAVSRLTLFFWPPDILTPSFGWAPRYHRRLWGEQRMDGGTSMRVAVIGASGYTGLELLRILLRHPEFEIAVATSEQRAGTGVGDAFPSLRGLVDLSLRAERPREHRQAGRSGVHRASSAALRLPHAASAPTVQALRAAGGVRARSLGGFPAADARDLPRVVRRAQGR